MKVNGMTGSELKMKSGVVKGLAVDLGLEEKSVIPFLGSGRRVR